MRRAHATVTLAHSPSEGANVQKCQVSGCEAAATVRIAWRTRSMPVNMSVVWEQCQRCSEESVAMLQQDPEVKSVRVRSLRTAREVRAFE